MYGELRFAHTDAKRTVFQQRGIMAIAHHSCNPHYIYHGQSGRTVLMYSNSQCEKFMKHSGLVLISWNTFSKHIALALRQFGSSQISNNMTLYQVGSMQNRKSAALPTIAPLRGSMQHLIGWAAVDCEAHVSEYSSSEWLDIHCYECWATDFDKVCLGY